MQAQVIGSHWSAGSRAVSRWDAIAAALMAAVVGALVVWGVGFAPITALHNAAHDTRHSLAFPCH